LILRQAVQTAAGVRKNHRFQQGRRKMDAGPKTDERTREMLLQVRRARFEDIDHVIALDARVTGLAKPDYWRDVFERYGQRRLEERVFFVAESDQQPKTILGYVVGEIRAWEFGSTPCGWIIALSVDPDARLQHIGERLFEAISDEFRRAGIDKLRTMVARDMPLHMSFFRSEGMMAGPYIQLEKSIETPTKSKTGL
jgi:ribosomal protein S18 acetylase RimI-like enzyme